VRTCVRNYILSRSLIDAAITPIFCRFDSKRRPGRFGNQHQKPSNRRQRDKTVYARLFGFRNKSNFLARRTPINEKILNN